ncbi:MAG: Fic family protein [Gammaproteobacteria bacterium]
MKRWNWQQSDWPRFRYDRVALEGLEAAFLREGGVLVGSFKHLADDDKERISVELATSEALNSAGIEGEVLDRDSVRSSILREFGLHTSDRWTGAASGTPADRGMAQMMVDLLRTRAEPLDRESLWRWHGQIMQGREDHMSVGAYRAHPDPMQVVSGPIHAPKVHFEAPPAERVANEMEAFLKWYQATAPGQVDALPALARAGIAHLYFVSIHPFEDGNGRLARAISEKALSQAIAKNRSEAAMIVLSAEIHRRRKAYYAALAAANRENEVTEWLLWFGETVLAAQADALSWIEFFIEKTKLLDGLRGRMNPRQEKALLRLLREGPQGFEGGLSAGKYRGITGASPATAGRDLAALVEMGALVRTGERRHTRYWLGFGMR